MTPSMWGYKLNHRPIFVFLVLCTISLPSIAQISFSATSYPLQATPSEVIAADVNGDGKPDLVTFSAVSGNVSVLLNKGDGTFASHVDFSAGTNPLGAFGYTLPALAIADFNGDQRLDIVVSNPANPGSSAGPSVNLLLGNGDGTFQPPTIFTLDFNYPLLVGVGDFNGDKKPDVALFGTDAAISLVMLLGNGDGTFSRRDFPLPFAHGSVAVVADFNQDGKLDVAFSGDNSYVYMFLGNGDATFQSPLQIGIDAFGPDFLGPGDFNHDGKADLVWTSHQWQKCEFRHCNPYGPPGSLQAMLGHGDGTFTPGALDSGDFGFAAAADFDGDGNLDLAVNGNLPSPSYKTNIYVGDGSGGFRAPIGVSLSKLPEPELTAADFNGDGLADVVVTDSNALVVALNTTPGFKLSTSPTHLPSVRPGESGSVTIAIGPQNGFNHAVSLTCSVPASVGIQCSLSSSSVSPGGSATLSVTTTGPSAALATDRGHLKLYAFCLAFAGLAVFGVGFGSQRKKRKKLLGLLLWCFLFGSLTFQTACSGNSKSLAVSTPPGNYTIMVTGTSGSLQRSTTVTLGVVQ